MPEGKEKGGIAGSLLLEGLAGLAHSGEQLFGGRRPVPRVLVLALAPHVRVRALPLVPGRHGVRGHWYLLLGRGMSSAPTEGCQGVRPSWPLRRPPYRPWRPWVRGRVATSSPAHPRASNGRRPGSRRARRPTRAH